MLATALTIVLIVSSAGLLSLIIFAWAFVNGSFDSPQDQAMVIFDEVELRFDRPWENPRQKRERIKKYGPLLKVPRSEWGGTR